mmetsp:Transcript_48566/g.94935  ORF Transcript_48566/g.94935 Transcript_48566/m.94935 type:complete len:348 (-) Transcript_48566:56-1099(-)
MVPNEEMFHQGGREQRQVRVQSRVFVLPLRRLHAGQFPLRVRRRRQAQVLPPARHYRAGRPLHAPRAVSLGIVLEAQQRDGLGDQGALPVPPRRHDGRLRTLQHQPDLRGPPRQGQPLHPVPSQRRPHVRPQRLPHGLHRQKIPRGRGLRVPRHVPQPAVPPGQGRHQQTGRVRVPAVLPTRLRRMRGGDPVSGEGNLPEYVREHAHDEPHGVADVVGAHPAAHVVGADAGAVGPADQVSRLPHGVAHTDQAQVAIGAVESEQREKRNGFAHDRLVVYGGDLHERGQVCDGVLFLQQVRVSHVFVPMALCLVSVESGEKQPRGVVVGASCGFGRASCWIVPPTNTRI